MSKYEIFVNILDMLRKEAPPEYKRYHPLDTDVEKLNQSRAKAFIHLFLKVKFGILDFARREWLVTDKSHDAGIDAYFIDQESKKVFFIQSKFRTNEDNFKEKEIKLSELLNMDVDRIVDGEHADENGIKYNGKIQQLLRELNEISDIGRYNYEVIILANLEDAKSSSLKKFTGGFPTTVFNFDKTYNELVFPVITGTYYNPRELMISINLSNKSSSGASISYNVTTNYKDCDITVLFVPTIEIAKTLYKYKNSILKYNPRSFLELANNTVNTDIAKTITDLSTNEFALFNNGITMLSYGTSFNQKIGQKGKAQLIITQPQIINGGQTAYTLSRIYEENLNTGKNEELFTDKEVLLKVITFPQDGEDSSAEHFKFIEAISKATNQQTPVDDADRRSNDSIQMEIQNTIYDNYGYFYQRKRGEYADGIRDNYIQRAQIIDRELFLRLCKSCDLNPAEARRASAKQLFKETNFVKTLNDVSRFKEYFFAFKCYEMLNTIERKYSKETNNKFGVVNYGYALRYGKFSVVSVCRLKYKGDESLQEIDTIINDSLTKWLAFESYIMGVPSNNTYFRSYYDQEDSVQKQVLNFDGYYKGRNLNADILKFFKEQS